MDVRPTSRRPIELPVAEGALARLEGAMRLWTDLPAEARERLRRDGVLVLGRDLDRTDAPTGRSSVDRFRSVGAFYVDLRDQRMPHMLTADALFALVHVGIVRALGHVEDIELAPALSSFLEKVDARLGAEQADVGTELAEAYRVARGVIAVARALEASPGNGAPPKWTPPPELVKVVAAEQGRIEGHGGRAVSTLLGVEIDYGSFAVPSSAARPGAYRALAWLGAAPLSLVARSEARGAIVDVARARTNTRAAMLLSRVCDREIDPEIHAAYAHLTRLLAFVWGQPDDLSLVEIDAVAEAAGIDLTKPENIANVARVDKVRARAMAGRLPVAHDGGGGVGRAALGVRVFGGHVPADSAVLQSLVGIAVGPAQEDAASAPVDRLRKGVRVLPSTLDLAAWLGAREAPALLRETHADAFEGYTSALAAAQRERDALERGALFHASVHGSLVDALIAWANAEPNGGAERSAPADRMRVESLLAAWTLVRHAGHPLAGPRPPASASASELRVSGAPLPVFVEPVPELVARLVALVRQLRRGLESVGPMAPSSSSASTLVEIVEIVEIEDILRIALRGAERHASDEPLTAEEATALASVPARIAKVEDDAGPDVVGPVAAVIHSDPASGRVLVSATGLFEPVLLLAREPGREEPLLVVGAHLAHHELAVGVERAPGVLHGVRPAVTDAWWRARLKNASTSAGADVGRAPWVASFRFTR